MMSRDQRGTGGGQGSGKSSLPLLKVRRPVVVVQLLSHVRLVVTPWTVAHQASLSFTVSWSLLKFMSFESVILSNHLILCCLLLLLPSIFPSIRVFSSKLALCISWPNNWSFSFSISPSSKYSGLISLRIDWFDLLAVQGTLKSLLQNHSSKASVLWCSAFFMVQLSHPYITTGKTIVLTTGTLVCKVMSLLFSYADQMSVASVSHFCRVHMEDSESHSVMSNSLQPHGLYSLWNSPGQNSGVVSHFLQGSGVGSDSLLQGSSQARDQTQVSCIAGGFFIS